jgi:hypothetical protein
MPLVHYIRVEVAAGYAVEFVGELHTIGQWLKNVEKSFISSETTQTYEI